MKVAIGFVLAAACFAVSISSPASRNVDWGAIRSKVWEVESAIRSASQQIKEVANSENGQVGSIISDQVDAAAVKALAILQQVHAAIDDQSLTGEKGVELSRQVVDIYARLLTDLQDELAQLSGAASNKIRDIFYVIYVRAEQLAQVFYAMLHVVMSILAVDWSAVSSMITQIEPIVCGAIRDIIIIASNDNEQVGSGISGQLYDACARAKAILEQVKAAIRDQTLTEEKAKELLGQLKDILDEIQADLQDELAQLSSGAAGQIRDLFYAYFASVEQKLQVIYALLRA